MWRVRSSRRARSSDDRGSADKPEGDGTSRLRHSLFAWGLVDQGLSSATTFLFTLIAGRNIGPAGLGTVTLGYTAFLIALGLQRSLLVDPLLTRISSSSRRAGQAVGAALTTTLVGGLLVSVLGALVGVVATGPESRGLLVFAPWIVPALAQALLRSWLYREGRGAIATASTAAWLVAMSALFGAGLHRSDWQVVASWGLGAWAGLAVVALGVTSLEFAGARASAAWFRQEAFGVGMWRTTSGLIFSAATYARTVGISLIIGPAAVGGYRAIETIFAPASFIGPALANPGLPMLRDSVEHRALKTWRLALRISLIGTGLALAYVIPVTVARGVVFRIFGSHFDDYASLIAPVAAGALVASMATGFNILLLAMRRMGQSGLLVVLNSGLSLALALPLAASFGLEAAAWGIALAGVPPLLLVVLVTRRLSRAFDTADREARSKAKSGLLYLDHRR